MSAFVSNGSMGEHTHAQVSEALANMAVLKNVPLSPAELDEAAGVLFTQMDWTQVHELTGLDGLAARSWAVNGHLDMIAVARLMGIVRDVEGKDDINDPIVMAVAQEIVTKLDAGLANKKCVHWPNLGALVISHYAGKPRGPTVGAREDGTVCTRWWLGLDFHRDPKEGPANIEEKGARRLEEYWVEGRLHREEEDGPAVIVRDNESGVIVDEQYWWHGKRHREGGPGRIRRDERGKVIFEGWYRDGQLHRDHNEGPALIDEAFDGLEIHCEEYHEDGKWHRPSEMGPAILNTDRAGEVLREFYVEHGQLHRDPKKGPAWYEIRDARTMQGSPDDTTIIKYAVNGQTHRNEEDGPAVTTRHNPTGVLLCEYYDRDGRSCRMRGPAIVERDRRGGVIFEAWCRGVGFHRDPKEGPAVITHDRETGITTEEFFVDGEKLMDASIAPSLIKRDASGAIMDEQLWDGQEMQVRPSETVNAEAGSHG